MKNDESLSLEMHPGYAAAFKRLQEVRGDLDRAEAAARRLEDEILLARQGRGGTLDLEAASRLAGDDVAAVNDLQGKFSKARREVEILARTVKLAEEAVDRQKRPASEVMCRKLAPEYEAAVRAIAAAAIALGKGMIAELAVRDSLAQAGANFCFQPMAFPGGGDPREYPSRISVWLMAAVVYGFISRTDIPEEWLDRWGCHLDAQLNAKTQGAGMQPAAKAARRADSANVVYS